VVPPNNFKDIPTLKSTGIVIMKPTPRNLKKLAKLAVAMHSSFPHVMRGQELLAFFPNSSSNGWAI